MVLFAALCAALIVAGCGSSSSSTTAPEESPSGSTSEATTADSGSGGSSDGPDVTLVSAFPLAGNPFYLTMECTAEAKADELGVDLKVVNPSEGDVQHELPLLQAAIATKPDVIILSSVDKTALASTVRQAMDEGIEFVYVDQLPDDLTGAVSAINYDTHELGELDAKALAKAMGNTGEAIEVTGPVGIPTVNQIHKGFVDGLEGTGVTLKETIYDSNNSNSTSANLTAAALSANPEITGINAWINYQSDGALTALRQLGRTDVSIVTNYANYDQLNQLEEGKYAALIGQPAGQMGEAAIEQAHNAAEGEPVEERITLPTFEITKENMHSAEAEPYEFVKSCN